MAAFGLPIPKLMIVIPQAEAEVMFASRPHTGTSKVLAKSSTYLSKLVSNIYSPKSSNFLFVYRGSQFFTISSFVFMFFCIFVQ